MSGGISRYALSYRDLEEMMQERGVEVDHSTLNRWVLKHAAELDKRIRPHLQLTNGSWRVDETYVKVKGEWKYLYRAVDSAGNTLDFMLECARGMALPLSAFSVKSCRRRIPNRPA
jgi:transposase-like protein